MTNGSSSFLRASGETSALSYAAAYHPWVVTGPEEGGEGLRYRPPGGAVAGTYAARALARGAWIAPANVPLAGALSLDPPLEPGDRGRLATRAVNTFARDPRGFFAIGQDTLSTEKALRPVNVRRLMILLRRLVKREGDTYEETVVSSSRAAQSPLDAPNSTTIVTAQDIRLSGLTNPAATIRRAAGVEVMEANPDDTQINVRGLNLRIANRTVVLVDGRSVYLDFLGGTIWRMIPLAVEDIERIEVIRGPASALYGADAFTGIINIITRPIGEGRSFITAGFGNEGQYRLASTVTERIDRLRFRIGGGYEHANHYSRFVGGVRFVYAIVNFALSAATARSQAPTRLIPAPAATPPTFAITGASMRARIASPAWKALQE